MTSSPSVRGSPPIATVPGDDAGPGVGSLDGGAAGDAAAGDAAGDGDAAAGEPEEPADGLVTASVAVGPNVQPGPDAVPLVQPARMPAVSARWSRPNGLIGERMLPSQVSRAWMERAIARPPTLD
jgi:hypothetical protein